MNVGNLNQEGTILTGIILLLLLLFPASVHSGCGWYLISPPPTGRGTVDPEAPVTRWLQSNAFDTAKACDDYLIDSYTRAEAKFRSVASVENKRSFDSLTFARCIVSDDPRLK
jgi:hypothetical protein